MKETLADKKVRIAKNKFDMSAKGMYDLFGKMSTHAVENQKKMFEEMPNLELPKELLDFNPE